MTGFAFNFQASASIFSPDEGLSQPNCLIYFMFITSLFSSQLLLVLLFDILSAYVFNYVFSVSGICL